MIEADLCLSPILGLSALDLREDGLGAVGCSDSEELDAIEEELDMEGDIVGRAE